MKSIFLGFCFQILTSAISAGAIASYGDILVTDSAADALFKIDRDTGVRTIISSATVGTGVTFQEPHAVAVAPDGSIIVTDAGRHALIRVDPITGNRTTLTTSNFINPYGMIIDKTGKIFVCDIGTNELTRYDANGGNRTLIVGNGFFDSPQALAFDASGTNIFVADAYEGSNTTSYIFETENLAYPSSTPSKISGGTTGSGVTLGFVDGIVFHNGLLYVSNLQDILTVSTSGFRSTLNSTLVQPQALTWDPVSQSLLTIDLSSAQNDTIVHIDSSTGVATELSGSGPSLTNARGITVYIPEPTTTSLIAFCFLYIISLRLRWMLRSEEGLLKHTIRSNPSQPR